MSPRTIPIRARSLRFMPRLSTAWAERLTELRRTHPSCELGESALFLPTPPADTGLVASIDHLQSLIERDDVYDPSSAPVVRLHPLGAFEQVARTRIRWLGVDAIRLLAALCVVSWSTVAVETWLLVR